MNPLYVLKELQKIYKLWWLIVYLLIYSNIFRYIQIYSDIHQFSQYKYHGVKTDTTILLLTLPINYKYNNSIPSISTQYKYNNSIPSTSTQLRHNNTIPSTSIHYKYTRFSHRSVREEHSLCLRFSPISVREEPILGSRFSPRSVREEHLLRIKVFS